MMKKHLKWRRRIAACLWAVMLVLSGCGQTQPETEETAEPDSTGNTVLAETARFLLEQTPEPGFGSVGGEWAALGLARWEGNVPDGWFDGYSEAVETYVKECEGVLHNRKYTEYSRTILALTAVGKDPADVAGYDLLVPLADYEQTTFQGINGAVFALLALDCGSYEIPENIADSTQATRELYVDTILEAELPEGGWSFSGGTAEADMTAMVLQALAKYRGRQAVAEAVERGLTVLSGLQNSASGDSQSSESVAQTIVALMELGISLEDPRFVNNGNTQADVLLQFRNADGGFSHLRGGDTDLLATEQAFYALVAIDRTEQGKSSLYTMK